MDIDGSLLEMEQAANILLNPMGTNRDLLKLSENVFINFSKHPLPIPDCFTILERSKIELVLFETVKMLKNVIIYEWRALSKTDKDLLRQKLMDFVITNQDLPPSVVERILQVIAIIIKRNYIEDGGEELETLMAFIREMLFTSASEQVHHVSCHIIVSILQEFTNTVKSEDLVLSFEEHFRAKKSFETKELVAVFLFVLEAIERLLPLYDASVVNHNILMDSLLKIMELILSWSYVAALIPKRIIRAFENLNNVKQQPSLRLSTIWQPHILQPRVLEVFFILYWRVRAQPQLQRKAINCLIQLSTLSGPVFGIVDSSFSYFQHYIQLLMDLLGNIEVDERDAFGVATILRKLLMIHNVKVELVKLPEEMATVFIDRMLMLTVQFIEMSAREDQSYGETVFSDACRSMLEAWLDLIMLVDVAHTSLIRNNTRHIFDKFIHCRVTPSGGSDADINEAEEPEREIFKEQLIIIGFLGRLSIEHALRTIATQMELKIVELCSAANGAAAQITQSFDALHWLVLIAGHTLCMESIGEKPLIPKEINLLSSQLQESSVTSAASTWQYLQAAVGQEDSSATQQCDPALRIFADVLRLCDLENRFILQGFGGCWSPLLSSTIMWFLAMFTNSYVHVEAVYYSPLAPIYTELMIAGAPAAAWTMNVILTKVAWNMNHYHHDVDVVEESIRLFLDIVNVRNKKLQHILELSSFQGLIQMRDLQLDSKIKRSVFKGLVMASAAFSNIEQKQNCLRHILMPIGEGFEAIRSAAGRHHETAVREKLLATLDEMTGIAQGTNVSTFEFVYQQLREHFHTLVELMCVYQNYLDIQCAILKVLIEMASTPMATSTAQSYCRDFYDVCIRCMRTFLERQSSRLAKTYADDEEQPDDVLMVIELFKKVTIQYILEPSDQSIVTSLGVQILSNLMPKMYTLLDRFPDITMAYYKSLNCFLELVVCSNELGILPDDLLNHLLYTSKIGLTSFTYPEIQSHSLDLLCTIGDALVQDTSNQLASLRERTIEPFIKLLFDIIVTLDLHNENKTDCYSTIYTLSCAAHQHEHVFHAMLKMLAEKQKQRQTYQTPQDSPEVEQLKVFEFRNSREQKFAFVDLFDKFIASISFLYHN